MKKLFYKSFVMAVLMIVVAPAPAMCQTEKAAGQATAGKPGFDWLQELQDRIEINGYAQGGYSWNDANGKQTNDFNLKRTLLWAKARITDRWSFLFMHDFSSVVQEYYCDFRVSRDKALTLRLGQFKNSLTMENPLSPTVLELIDVCTQGVTFYSGCGSDPLHGVNYGRDLGLKAFGELLDSHLLYEVAVMNGQGINKRDGNNKKDVIVKLDVRPVDGLRFVASGQKGTGHAIGTCDWNPAISVGDDYRRDRLTGGAEYKFGLFAPGKYKEARPVSLRGEYLTGKDGEVNSQAAYVMACVPVAGALDVIACADWFDRNTSMDYDQTQATVGLQYWFYKKCRVQLQYTRTWSQFQKDYNNLQAQLQVAF